MVRTQPIFYQLYWQFAQVSPSLLLTSAAKTCDALGWIIVRVSNLTLLAYKEHDDSDDSLTVQLLENGQVEMSIDRSGDPKDVIKLSLDIELRQFRALWVQYVEQASETQENHHEAFIHLLKKYNQPYADSFKSKEPYEIIRRQGWQGLLLINRQNIFTPTIIYVNLLILALMLLDGFSNTQGTPLDYVSWGANIGTLTATGEWWRLLTYNFIHADITHLGLNMAVLMFTGAWLTILVNRWWIPLIYMLSGIWGGLCSLLFQWDVPSVGASGAIFGMNGFLVVLLYSNVTPYNMRKSLLTGMSLFLAYSLLSGFFSPYIDNAAHIGGLLCGIFCGGAYIWMQRHDYELGQKLTTAFSLIGLTTIASLFILLNVKEKLPTAQERLTKQKISFKIESKIPEFYEFEHAANDYLQLLEENADREVILQEIRKNTYGLMKRNDQLLEYLFIIAEEQADLDNIHRMQDYNKAKYECLGVLENELTTPSDQPTSSLLNHECVKNLQRMLSDIRDNQ